MLHENRATIVAGKPIIADKAITLLMTERKYRKAAALPCMCEVAACSSGSHDSAWMTGWNPGAAWHASGQETWIAAPDSPFRKHCPILLTNPAMASAGAGFQ
ncbi:hypothetical protein ACLB6G_12575 [Zhengella sp. ZM62]|uniref:hypothetical protein n=1 Tax=Zhengella sedimenti TaxID=3390035 RepID=UPI003974E042